MATCGEKMYKVLKKTSLFQGIDDEGIQKLLFCLHAYECAYGDGEIILLAGYPCQRIGIVLSGGIEAVKEKADGSVLMIARMKEGGIFGDVLFGSTKLSPVTVRSLQCSVLFLPYDRILSSCDFDCYNVFMRNLISEISDKYFDLSARLDLISIKSLRERILTYLSGETPAMTRERLAAYLNCDRSALSRELSRMAAEGIIKIEGRNISLRVI